MLPRLLRSWVPRLSATAGVEHATHDLLLGQNGAVLTRGFAEGLHGCKLFVGNLPWSTTAEDLQQAFGKYGCREAYVVMDHILGRSKGVAFVTLDGGASASKAIEEMHGQEFGGRKLRVEEAALPTRLNPNRDSMGYGGGAGYGGAGYQPGSGYARSGGYKSVGGAGGQGGYNPVGSGGGYSGGGGGGYRRRAEGGEDL